MRGLGTGAGTWDAAILISFFFEHIRTVHNGHLFLPSTSSEDIPIDIALLTDQKWVEIGAGTGVTGMVAAALGVGKVIVSDLPFLVPLLQENIGRNALGGKVDVVEYDWANPAPAECRGANLVVICDCIYTNIPWELLYRSMLDLSDPALCAASGKPPPPFLIAYEQRNLALTKKFWEMKTEHFEARRIGVEHYHPDYVSGDIELWVFRRRTLNN